MKQNSCEKQLFLRQLWNNAITANAILCPTITKPDLNMELQKTAAASQFLTSWQNRGKFEVKSKFRKLKSEQKEKCQEGGCNSKNAIYRVLLLSLVVTKYDYHWVLKER